MLPNRKAFERPSSSSLHVRNETTSETVSDCHLHLRTDGAELLEKIRRISESLGATLYPVDASPDKRNLALQQVTSRIEDLSSVLHNTSLTRKTELVRLADSISAWWGLIRQEKVIYHTLNYFAFDAGRRTLVAEAWVPTRDIGTIQQALRQATVRSFLYEELD
jgi:V-type H+-transporting ATPase subunit a